MIDLHYWTTPNGHKISIYLEETQTLYRIVPVNIGKGEQFEASFLAIAPNNRIPAIVDHDPPGGGEPIAVFESGAILLYLADKSRTLIPQDLRGRTEALEWLFWQMAGLGPMAGQNGHFNHAAPEKIPYAIDRYERETARLFAVLDRRLEGRDFVAGAGRGEYSIADIASYPWVAGFARLKQDITQFVNLKRWHDAIAARPATQRAYALVQQINPPKPAAPLSEEERRLLYGQSATSVRR
jgi:GST-like protein